GAVEPADAHQPPGRRRPLQRAARAASQLTLRLAYARTRVRARARSRVRVLVSQPGEAWLNRLPVCTYHLRPSASYGIKTHHRREALGRRRHRAHARWLRAQGRLLRERPISAVVRARPSARARGPRRVRGEEGQVVVQTPACDSAVLRASTA